LPANLQKSLFVGFEPDGEDVAETSLPKTRDDHPTAGFSSYWGRKAGAHIALRLSKQEVNRGQETDLETSLAFATACSFIAAASEDHKGGIKALAERRAPVFKGR
jgi:enoyl-CoA hydratase/carnithine racemase